MLKSNAISFIDTHSHLFWDSYKEDLSAVIERAVTAGVRTVINVGVDIELSKMATEQAKKESRTDFKIYSSVAIHPEKAVKYWGVNQESGIMEQDLATLEEIYHQNPNIVVAIGECGLDFAYFNREGYLPEGLSVEKAKGLQRKLFKAQIDLAKKLNLPILVHCRDDKQSSRSDDLKSKDFNNTECWDEVVEMTKDWKGIYHCYSGLLPTTHYILENTNFLVSFAGNLTYPKNDYLKEAVKILPLERIVLETDCPFLPPQSIRGERNEPTSVKEIAHAIAEIKNEPFEKVARQTTENFQKLFNLQTVN